MGSKNLNIEINFDGKVLDIAEESSSGCVYRIHNERELLEYAMAYVLDCLDPDIKYGFELKEIKTDLN